MSVNLDIRYDWFSEVNESYQEWRKKYIRHIFTVKFSSKTLLKVKILKYLTNKSTVFKKYLPPISPQTKSTGIKGLLTPVSTHE